MAESTKELTEDGAKVTTVATDENATAAPPVECLRQLGCTCRACSVSLLEAQGPTAEAEPAQRRRTLGARRAGVSLLFEPIQR